MPETIQKRIQSFVELGNQIQNILNKRTDALSPVCRTLQLDIKNAENKNIWFTRDNILYALQGIAHMLEKKTLEQWLSAYPLQNNQPESPKTVSVVMAGNLPFVGFHDFMCVLLSGNVFLGKLSSQDTILPVKLAELLIEIEPAWKSHIRFTEERISGFDAVIATGSNNSARYFEYYFGKYPHIIRKNRSSVAILSGNESDSELRLLADDIFLYFGKGCRNVSKILVPRNYNFPNLLQNFEHWEFINQHNKYCNNYEYHKAIYLVNQDKHLDNGFLLLKEDTGLSSPLSVLYYQYYDSWDGVERFIAHNKESIQCIVSNMYSNKTEFSIVPFGKTQTPEPTDYADGVDVMNFLINL